MKTAFIIKCLLAFLALHGWSAMNGQAPLPEQPRPIEAAQWDRAVGSLDYSKDRPAEELEQEQERDGRPARQPRGASPGWNWDGSGLGLVFQIIAIVLLVGLVAYGVYRMMQEPRNRQIARDGVEITLENLEEYLHETDLERFLRAALAEKNYAQAVRLYYLQAIKDLSAKNYIRWSREKTNRDYARELRNGRFDEPFRAATRTFERVWYGNSRLDEGQFRELEPTFKTLLSSI